MSSTVKTFVFGLCFFALSSTAFGFSMPIHGRWCGMGHGFNGPPVDAVDRLCMLHDICVKKTLSTKKVKKYVHGLQYCHCDWKILSGIDAALRTVKKQGKKKAYQRGLLIKTYFKNTRCFCDKRVCLPKPVCKKVKVCTDRFSTLCVYKPICKKVRKCKKVLGKQRCLTVPSCKKVKVCKRVFKGKACIYKPSCRKKNVCKVLPVFGKGGRCS